MESLLHAFSILFYKGICPKINWKNWHFTFCIFCFIFFDSKCSLPHRSICLINMVLLIPIFAYFMTNLCHMAYVKKFHKTPFYDVLWHALLVHERLSPLKILNSGASLSSTQEHLEMGLANFRIYLNIWIFLAEYLIFEYKYIRIFWQIKSLGSNIFEYS